MPTHQPCMTNAQGTRRFACLAVALQAIILKEHERILLPSSPTRNRLGESQVISGGLFSRRLPSAPATPHWVRSAW